jgi:hypothetical protein
MKAVKACKTQEEKLTLLKNLVNQQTAKNKKLLTR